MSTGGWGVLASVPYDLTNFQDAYPCDPNTSLIVRPKSLEDVAQAVRMHNYIRANGEGHSWNQPFFCAKPGSTLDTSSTVPAAPLGVSATLDASPAPGGSSSTPPSAVDEASEAVWVDGGVKTSDLLEYLRNHVSPSAPAGWTLGAFPWFVHQTIAGAVATNSHGSSLKYKSLSDQVLALDVVLANGTRRVFTNATDVFLMKALRVSVGKLGVIGRVKLHIVKEVPVQRMIKALTPPEFLALLQHAQDAWAEGGGSLPHWMMEADIFWITQKHQFLMVSFARADEANSTESLAEVLSGFQPDNTTVFHKKGDLLSLGELVLPADAALNINSSRVLVESPHPAAAVGGLDPYLQAQQWLNGFVADVVNSPVAAAVRDEPEARIFYGADNMAEGLMEISRVGVLTIAGNSSGEPTAMYIKQPGSTLPSLRMIPFDQYEGDLLGTDPAKRSIDKGFRTAPLIRFVGQEDGLLSLTNGGPRMFVNIEDYLFHNRGPYRIHWGKSGWPDAGCFHGDQHFGDSWCHFGCAIKALDPGGKFSDASSHVWTWQGVDLTKCCGPEGFVVQQDACQCRVQHVRSMSSCPPPPFYTGR
eukprot:gene10758-10914_t